jgi:uncharacterized protein YjbJ (UPF0337 family)
MNWQQIQDKWLHYKVQIQQRWSGLTDDDFTLINGRRNVLAGKIRQRSGATEDQIEKEIAEFETTCKAVTPVAVTPADGTA